MLITDKKQVGQFIKAAREEKKLTYYAVAKLSGLNIHQVKKIEAGVKGYNFESFLKITNALKLSLFIDKNDE